MQSFDGEEIFFRGFLTGEGELTLYGDTVHGIRSLAAFGETFASESEIPIYTERTEYDLGLIAQDFSLSAAPPCDGFGKEIKGAEILGSRLSLPREWDGEVLILYKAAPPSVYALLSDAPINIPREQEGLLPLLTASFLWLDDDFEKASYYMSLYRSALKANKWLGNGRQCSRFVSTNGWA